MAMGIEKWVGAIRSMNVDSENQNALNVVCSFVYQSPWDVTLDLDDHTWFVSDGVERPNSIILKKSDSFCGQIPKVYQEFYIVFMIGGIGVWSRVECTGSHLVHVILQMYKEHFGITSFIVFPG